MPVRSGASGNLLSSAVVFPETDWVRADFYPAPGLSSDIKYAASELTATITTMPAMIAFLISLLIISHPSNALFSSGKLAMVASWFVYTRTPSAMMNPPMITE